MYPDLLQTGDEVRVIAPSRSMTILDPYVIEIAVKRLTQMGLRVTFGAHVNSSRPFYNSATVQERLSDLHQAFADARVKAILTVVGGYSCNQLLPYIDYDLIRRNPKILCGLSDITALQNAIYSCTGMVTFSGPHFSNFGMKYGFEYTQRYFQKLFMQEGNSFSVESSQEYSSDVWYQVQDARTFQLNSGMAAIQPGCAAGTIIGGNLCTLNLLLGTKYLPSLRDTILFLEDTCNLNSNYFLEFDRQLEALTQQPDFSGVRGIVLGRAEDAAGMTEELWRLMILSKPALAGIPVIMQANIGHTTPIFTFPIGGRCAMHAAEHCRLEIQKHE